MTPKYFTKLLKAHDWYYHLSDDSAAFRKGLHEANVIRQAVTDNPDLKPVLDEFVAGMNTPVKAVA